MPHSQQTRAGLTLLEMLGVLMLLAIASTTVALSMLTLSARAREQQQLEQVRYHHEQARRLAITRAASVLLEYDAEAHVLTRRMADDAAETKTVMSQLADFHWVVAGSNGTPASIQIRYSPTGQHQTWSCGSADTTCVFHGACGQVLQFDDPEAAARILESERDATRNLSD